MTGYSETMMRLMEENTCLRERSRMLDRLVFEVCRAFPGETRFDTALRYIRQAEERAREGSVAQQENPK